MSEDDLHKEIKEIRKIIEDKFEILTGKLENPGPFDSVILTSASPSVTLNPSYTYDVAFNLLGGSSTVVAVSVLYVSDTTPNPGRLYMNNESSRYNLKGIRVNQISFDNSASTAAVLVVAYLGSRQIQEYGIKS